MFHILLFGVWISDKTLLLGLIYNFFVFGYQMKHSYSCLIYHFSLVIPNKTPHLVLTTVQHTLICFFRLLLKSLTLKLWAIKSWNTPRQWCSLKKAYHLTQWYQYWRTRWKGWDTRYWTTTWTLWYCLTCISVETVKCACFFYAWKCFCVVATLGNNGKNLKLFCKALS